MFVQVIQGHTADATELKAAAEQWLRELAPGAQGWVGTTGGATADGQAILLACFESAEAAQRNGERPEQHQWWMETSKLFAGDVAFHDCREVYEMGRGVPDQAGFVQVIQGRCTDVQRARELISRMDEPMQTARPDVLGGLVCMHDEGDGRFTQAVYFTSEAEAREGERRELPPEARTLFDEQMSILTDLVYFDLTEPWMYAR